MDSRFKTETHRPYRTKPLVINETSSEVAVFLGKKKDFSIKQSALKFKNSMLDFCDKYVCSQSVIVLPLKLVENCAFTFFGDGSFSFFPKISDKFEKEIALL